MSSRGRSERSRRPRLFAFTRFAFPARHTRFFASDRYFPADLHRSEGPCAKKRSGWAHAHHDCLVSYLPVENTPANSCPNRGIIGLAHLLRCGHCSAVIH